MVDIGFIKGRLEDASRSNWPGDGPRPVAWSAWYPTEQPRGRDLTVAAQAAPSLFVVDDVVEGASLASRQQMFPVVLLSHGTGGSASGLSWLASRLARAGFVVVGADHHGNTATEAYRAEGFLCWWERTRDLTVLLDHHFAEGPFVGRLDRDRVFAAGFSLGGYTILSLLGAVTDMALFRDWATDKPLGNGPKEFPAVGDQVTALLQSSSVFRQSWDWQSASYKDARVKAALLCAPAPTVRSLTTDSLQAINVPVAIAAVGADLEAPSDLCAEWVHQLLPNSTFSLVDPVAGHYAFLCECSEWGKANVVNLCADPSGVDRRHIHDMTASLGINLFSRFA